MPTAPSPLTVVVVEDNPNDAMLIRRHLEGSDSAFLPDEIRLYHETTLEAGLDRLESVPADLLLLDLGLPESEGVETFERARPHVASVPVVVLTNLDDEKAAVELLKRGAQDYLNKGSLGERELVKSVRYALERQEQKQVLRTTTEQLEVLNRILRHDISNDVQVLQAWSEHLLGAVEADHVDDVRRIVQAAEHIRELTENSRAFIRAVVGEGELETVPVRVDEVLEEELGKARSIHDATTFEVRGEFPRVTVSANEMLASVFRNLFNNAVQHAGDRARVTVTAEHRDGTVRVTVADDGPGVPDERKHEIFGKGEHGLDSDGTGIGLYLVNTLVTEFGGEVWVEDRDPTGAAFVVELPTVPA